MPYAHLNNKTAVAERTAAVNNRTRYGGHQRQGKGILHGANVVMPNLSPLEHRKDYSLYDNKICTGDESAQCISCMKNRMKSIGYEVVTDVGNYIAP